MKILYVSQYFPPEMGAPAARVSELSRLWASHGHDVTVLTGFPNHPIGVIPAEYRSKFRRLVIREDFENVPVVRTWLLPFPNCKSWERILSYGSFCLSAAATGSFLPCPDVVIATSPQLLVGLSGWWLARIKRVPFVLEIRDLWPESLAAVGTGSQTSLLYRALGRIAHFLYTAADRIVVVTPAFKDHLIRAWNVPSEKIAVVENGVDCELFRPRENTNPIRQQMNAQGKLVFSYIGTVGMAHGLKTLIDAASQMQQSASNVVFWVLGEGAEKEQIVSLARSRHLTNIRFIDQQSREKIPDYISASDACMVLLKKSELFKTVLPTKMLEFMACARPTIVGVDGYARQLVEDANAGIWVEPENPTALANAVTRLAQDESLRYSLGNNGRDCVQQNFTRQRSAQNYIAFLEDLLDSQDPMNAPQAIKASAPRY